MLTDVFTLFAERPHFFFGLLGEHMWIAGSAAALAAVIGAGLGILISEYSRLAPWVIQSSNILYTIPAISLFGLLIPFSGIGNTTAVLALTLYGLLPMVGHTHTGIQSIDPAVLDAVCAALRRRGARWRLAQQPPCHQRPPHPPAPHVEPSRHPNARPSANTAALQLGPGAARQRARSAQARCPA